MMKLERLFSDFSEASKQSGRTIGALFVELMKLRFGTGRIGASEYFDFRLHMNDLTLEQKRAFGGYRTEAILEEILIDDYARFLSLDKISMYALLAGYKLPIPTIRAVYRSERPSSLLSLDSPQALASYLETPGSLPVYVKPSFGSYGRGNLLLNAYDQGDLILGDESRVELNNFCQSLDGRSGLGWILQEPLVSHSAISELCGSKLSGVRIHSFLSNAGSVITNAIWKVNSGNNDSDNFCYGESGNLLAALDTDTGEVIRVISGTGLNQLVGTLHSKTGAQLVGFRIPYWKEIVSLVHDAHLAFPGYLCPGWDVAVCDDGPKILEINYFGDICLPQHAYHRGFVDNFLLSLMHDRGLEHLLTGRDWWWERNETTGRYGRRKHHWRW